MSNFRSEGRRNSGDNVFRGIPVGVGRARVLPSSSMPTTSRPNTLRAFTQDMRKFARWFVTANSEPFTVKRVTVRDITDFRDHLRRAEGRAVSTVNRRLGHVATVFRVARRPDPHRGQSRPARERIETAGVGTEGIGPVAGPQSPAGGRTAPGHSGGAVFSLLLYTGCRVGDLVNLN